MSRLVTKLGQRSLLSQWETFLYLSLTEQADPVRALVKDDDYRLHSETAHWRPALRPSLVEPCCGAESRPDRPLAATLAAVSLGAGPGEPALFGFVAAAYALPLMDHQTWNRTAAEMYHGISCARRLHT
ncbi:hypothetical protein ACTMTJ_43765 [Phytohabitans sp. LJ34]|uniref:hypothetical protein n=1 Tax=Phytohabitans sp. LJ34 TaxID=3452217 RepID=UPI003F88AC01